MTTFFGFQTIKSILALCAAWGCQTLPQYLSARIVNVSWNSCVLYVDMATVTVPGRGR